MAEKYGTVPKKFTKAWWEYFWMYYKWHTIIIAFILLAILVTVYQSATQEKYDLHLAYAGDGAFTEQMAQSITDEISPLCNDIDGDGKNKLLFLQYNLDGNGDFEYAAAMQMKLTLSLSEEDIFVYILDKETAAANIGEKAEESCFIPLNDWFNGSISEDKLFSAHNINYGVELTECEAFKAIAEKYNADFSGNYLFVRYYPREDQSEQIPGHTAAMELAQKIVNSDK